MTRPIQVLVAEDDPKIAKVVEHLLRREGYQVARARDGREALTRVEVEPFDLLLLDIGLPEVDGFEVCRRVKARSDLPVIVLSARGEELDRVMGLTLGADDYIAKPFNSAELVLRVKAVLRRARSRGADSPSEMQRVQRGNLTLDRSSRQAWLGEREVSLTGKEFDILWTLAQRPGQVWTREQLLQQVWDTDYMGDSSTLTVLVRRLREKIEPDPAEPQYIRTVYGVGYRFVEVPPSSV